MLIRTTANIDKKIYEKIIASAEFLGIKPKQLVHVIFKILILEKPFKFRVHRTVQYQGRRGRDNWKCFHLELSEAVHESGIDMRKLMKWSVSFLLSYGVEVYMERAVREIESGYADVNYPDVYVIFARHTPKRSTFTVFHTLPEEYEYPDDLQSSA
jgi:hypothetical protein